MAASRSVPDLRVIVFSGAAPIEPYRLLDRIERDVPGAQAAGVLYVVPRPKTLTARARGWLTNLSSPGYPAYVLQRIGARVGRQAADAGHALLRLAQASRVCRVTAPGMSFVDLEHACRHRGWQLLVSSDPHGVESLEFVASQRPDLGIVLGTGILKPALYALPRLGSINIHKRKVPAYRGGGPVGLWELLDGQHEIGVTVHRVEEKVDTGGVIRSARIVIDPYDTIESLDLKAAVVGEDTLVAAVHDFSAGTAREVPQAGPARTFRTPKPWVLRQHRKALARVRPRYRALRSRPIWKLLLRASLYLGPLPTRNWMLRSHKRFPVVILYHHLVSDRPHPLGLPTDAFVRHLRYLKRHYRIVSLDHAVALLASGAVSEPTIALTMDDGYGDNFVNLRAALRAEPAPMALFVCSRLIAENRPFPHEVRDRREGFSPLTPEQVRALAVEDITIGSHGRTHLDCGTRDRDQLTGEIVGSRTDLEAMLNREVRYFAFPFGHRENMSPEAMAIATSAYRHHFSAYGGANIVPAVDFQHLRRVSWPSSLWELELALQGALEVREPASRGDPVGPVGASGADDPRVTGHGVTGFSR